MNVEEQSITTNVLAAFSSMLTDLVDQRVNMRMRRTLAAFANSEDFATKVTGITDEHNKGLVEGAVTLERGQVISDAVYTAISGRLDVQIKNILNQVLRDAIQEEMQKPPVVGHLAAVVEDTVRNSDSINSLLDDKAEESVESWLEDTANTNRLLKDIDLDDVVLEILRNGEFTVEFRGR